MSLINTHKGFLSKYTQPKEKSNPFIKPKSTFFTSSLTPIKPINYLFGHSSISIKSFNNLSKDDGYLKEQSYEFNSDFNNYSIIYKKYRTELSKLYFLKDEDLNDLQKIINRINFNSLFELNVQLYFSNINFTNNLNSIIMNIINFDNRSINSQIETQQILDLLENYVKNNFRFNNGTLNITTSYKNHKFLKDFEQLKNYYNYYKNKNMKEEEISTFINHLNIFIKNLFKNYQNNINYLRFLINEYCQLFGIFIENFNYYNLFVKLFNNLTQTNLTLKTPHEIKLQTQQFYNSNNKDLGNNNKKNKSYKLYDKLNVSSSYTSKSFTYGDLINFIHKLENIGIMNNSPDKNKELEYILKIGLLLILTLYYNFFMASDLLSNLISIFYVNYKSIYSKIDQSNIELIYKDNFEKELVDIYKKIIQPNFMEIKKISVPNSLNSINKKIIDSISKLRDIKTSFNNNSKYQTFLPNFIIIIENINRYNNLSSNFQYNENIKKNIELLNKEFLDFINIIKSKVENELKSISIIIETSKNNFSISNESYKKIEEHQDKINNYLKILKESNIFNKLNVIQFKEILETLKDYSSNLNLMIDEYHASIELRKIKELNAIIQSGEVSNQDLLEGLISLLTKNEKLKNYTLNSNSINTINADFDNYYKSIENIVSPSNIFILNTIYLLKNRIQNSSAINSQLTDITDKFKNIIEKSVGLYKRNLEIINEILDATGNIHNYVHTGSDEEKLAKKILAIELYLKKYEKIKKIVELLNKIKIDVTNFTKKIKNNVENKKNVNNKILFKYNVLNNYLLLKYKTIKSDINTDNTYNLSVESEFEEFMKNKNKMNVLNESYDLVNKFTTSNTNEPYSLLKNELCEKLKEIIEKLISKYSEVNTLVQYVNAINTKIDKNDLEKKKNNIKKLIEFLSLYELLNKDINYSSCSTSNPINNYTNTNLTQGITIGRNTIQTGEQLNNNKTIYEFIEQTKKILEVCNKRIELKINMIEGKSPSINSRTKRTFRIIKR